ncbi:hypothetical protein [Desulfurobacterium sp.]|uniref:hypothetical protein n=1 Tax=Desulfurobacterium sp. TaxID=2004706 RepID=UPI00262F20CB|nr:hypothetical protein [Desulfurobacterium sp.]
MRIEAERRAMMVIKDLDRTAARRVMEERLGRILAVPEHMWHLDSIVYADEKCVEALKGVTGTDYCWMGHLRFEALMPATVMIEFAANACGWHSVVFHGHTTCPVKITKAVFREKVLPGNVLKAKATLLKKKKNYFSYLVEFYVSEKNVAQIEELLLFGNPI